MLLGRETIGVAPAVERLLGMQAQQPRPPFTGLWTRLEGFRRDDLLGALRTKKAVRVTMWRGTLHILSTSDYLRFRGSLQPVLTAGMESILSSLKAELNVAAVLKEAEGFLRGRPQTFGELRAALLEKFPEGHERAMGYATRTHLPLVMVPDESDCGFPPDACFGLAKEWLGRPIPDEERTEDLVVRYLSAFGPATAADAQAWSGLAKLKPVFEALRPRLRVFRDERGKELFDVVDAALPDADTPAPVKFLPGFDNAILGHKDRSRIIAEEFRPRVTTKNLQVLPTFLVDGFVAGTWEFESRKKGGTLSLTPFVKIGSAAKRELQAEGEKLARFLQGESGSVEIVFG